MKRGCRALLIAAALGLLVGAVMGGLGGGGGVLTVPVLVYALGQSAHDATTGSVVIVGIAAVAGFLARVRDTDVRTALGFGAVGIPAAVLGTQLNAHAAQSTLMLAFAGLTMVAAATMVSAPADRPAAEAAPQPGPAAWAGQVAAWGALTGFLTGLLGVGGGFLVVPALVVALRLPIDRAVGTSLLVIALNAAAALGTRADDLQLDWWVVGPFTAAATLGTLGGKLVADRLSGRTLTRAFAVLLTAVGAAVGLQTLLG